MQSDDDCSERGITFDASFFIVFPESRNVKARFAAPFGSSPKGSWKRYVTGNLQSAHCETCPNGVSLYVHMS